MRFRTGSRKIIANTANSEGFSGRHWPPGDKQPWDKPGFGAPRQPKLYKPEDAGKEEEMEVPHRSARDLYK